MPRHIQDKEIGNYHLVFYETDSFNNRLLYGFLMADHVSKRLTHNEVSYFPIEFRQEFVARRIYERISSPDDFNRECHRVKIFLEGK